MLPCQKILTLQYETSMTRCKGCNHHCLLTVNTFDGGRQFISGNRCERGLGQEVKKKETPNLFDYKYRRIFNYKPLAPKDAPRGTVGIPRVLNMYEDYPFWAVFFRKLGFSVILSPKSSRKVYEMGIESIPSESECYPAKLAHGHISWLIKKEPDVIFYPSIPYERKEVSGAQNHYNCPIVTSYSENIKNNVEELSDSKIRFLNPFMSFSDEKTVTERLTTIFQEEFNIPAKEVAAAAHAGWTELLAVRDDIRQKGEEILRYME